jgi:hypothetical protein
MPDADEPPAEFSGSCGSTVQVVAQGLAQDMATLPGPAKISSLPTILPESLMPLPEKNSKSPSMLSIVGLQTNPGPCNSEPTITPKLLIAKPMLERVGLPLKRVVDVVPFQITAGEAGLESAAPTTCPALLIAST